MRVVCAMVALLAVVAAAPQQEKQAAPIDLSLPDFHPSITPTNATFCQRRSRNVNFTLLPWGGKEIIAPKTYDAGYCAGACPTTLRTAHAVVATAASAQAREPCCVPTELRPVSVLYFDNDLNVVYGKIKDMTHVIVKTCGCR